MTNDSKHTGKQGVALIVSLNFNPGHASHLVASYRQMEELGYESVCYVDYRFRGFLPDSIRIVDSSSDVPQCKVAMITFPSIGNLNLIHKLHSRNAAVVYIFHEPLASLKEFRKAGFTLPQMARLWLIDKVNQLTVKRSNHVVIPSQKAFDNYRANHAYRNPNVSLIPLMYDDELTSTPSQERKYISYIGTVASDHSFDEFLAYAKVAVEKGWHPGYRFLIATKSDFIVPEKLANNERVTIVKGKPLTNEEINSAYASSVVVWNAYVRTTQSGVLAKAFMFGTPALVLKENLNEFTTDGTTVESITDNSNPEEIRKKTDRIISDFNRYSVQCRRLFLDKFHYRNHNSEIVAIIQHIIPSYRKK